MMAGKGGYQRPTSPAPTSGPGALSQRTDGGPGSKQAAKYVAGMPYGEGADFMDLQSVAPMEAAGQTPSAPAQSARRPSAMQPSGGGVTPLTAPSQMPHIPVTDGAALGPGGGLESLGLRQAADLQDQNFAASIAAYMPVLMQVAANPNTSSETRDIIRQLRNML